MCNLAWVLIYKCGMLWKRVKETLIMITHRSIHTLISYTNQHIGNTPRYHRFRFGLRFKKKKGKLLEMELYTL